MNSIHVVLAELSSRLPELEWKISSLAFPISKSALPKGLFRFNQESSACHFITEIKDDIRALEQQKNERSALYMAERIKQKINVLVTLCQMNEAKSPREKKVALGLSMLSTRQQWIHDLEQAVSTLEAQYQAISHTLAQRQKGSNDLALLTLRAELGALEKRLTLAKETLQQAIS